MVERRCGKKLVSLFLPVARAYVKESLQLQRNEKMLTSCKKKFYHLLKISTTFFVVSTFEPLLKTLQVQLHRQFLLTIFSSFTQHFLYTFRFSPLFSALALPNLQLQLHNCHFTTANYIVQLQKLSSVER